MKKLLTIIFLTIFTFACNTINVESKNSLISKKFEIQNKEYLNKGIYLEFKENEIYAFTGVNNYFAGYSIKNNKLELGAGGSTLKMGSLQDMQLERKLIESLYSTTKINFEKDILTLYTKNGILYFKEVINIENKEFYLENNPKITLLFKNGKISGFSGVNKYFSNYSLKDDNIKINAIATTRMAGNNIDMKNEFEYLKLLQNMENIKIENGKLILYSKNSNLTFIEKK